jgi:CCR4-NOT transcription complex subunit 9
MLGPVTKSPTPICVLSNYFSKKREVVQDLAPMLWHSFGEHCFSVSVLLIAIMIVAKLTTLSFSKILSGTIAALLQEIVNIYPVINPPNLTVSLRRNTRWLGYA